MLLRAAVRAGGPARPLAGAGARTRGVRTVTASTCASWRRSAAREGAVSPIGAAGAGRRGGASAGRITIAHAARRALSTTADADVAALLGPDAAALMRSRAYRDGAWVDAADGKTYAIKSASQSLALPLVPWLPEGEQQLQ